uniref:Zinc finger protein 513 n=1 Tax=Pavo cristatus TaxID=9049 RepID=A0A8C9G6C1_PAVCR
MKTHNGEKPFACPQCAYASAQLVNLTRHLRTHTGEKPYRCTGCSFLGLLAEELRSASTVLPADIPASLCLAEPLLPELNLHMGSGTGPFLPGCARLLAVLGTEPGASPRKGTGDKGFACSLCPFVTHYPNHLARHMKTHSGEKPFACPLCPYASAHLDNLKRHQRVHTGEKPYKCQLCDYACGNLANLKRHGRIHSGDKPFQCSLCSYSCNQSMNLKRHMLRHTGEKPFQCRDCTYTTGHWDNYKRHQKIHGHTGRSVPPGCCQHPLGGPPAHAVGQA